MRRWHPTEPFEFDGIYFRIVPGDKITMLGEHGKDLRLEIYGENGWRAVHMRLGGFLADFFCDNEEVLYPPVTPDGFKTQWKGAKKYLAYLRQSWHYGWEKAEAELQAERQQKTLL